VDSTEKTQSVNRKKVAVKSAALAVFTLCLLAGLCHVRTVRAKGIIPLYTVYNSFAGAMNIQRVQNIEGLFLNSDQEQTLLTQLRNSQDISAAPDRQQAWKVVRMRVTAYCPCSKCCGRHADGVTACLHRIKTGDSFVAADRKLPFGTEMIIPGYNQERPVEVLDRGRVIRGNRLDVFFNSHTTAKKWGTKYLDVLVKAD